MLIQETLASMTDGPFGHTMLSVMEYVFGFRSRFLTLDLTDLWGWIVLCEGAALDIGRCLVASLACSH